MSDWNRVGASALQIKFCATQIRFHINPESLKPCGLSCVIFLDDEASTHISAQISPSLPSILSQQIRWKIVPFSTLRSHYMHQNPGNQREMSCSLMIP